jgi:hypothetical protein
MYNDKKARMYSQCAQLGFASFNIVFFILSVTALSDADSKREECKGYFDLLIGMFFGRVLMNAILAAFLFTGSKCIASVLFCTSLLFMAVDTRVIQAITRDHRCMSAMRDWFPIILVHAYSEMGWDGLVAGIASLWMDSCQHVH